MRKYHFFSTNHCLILPSVHTRWEISGATWNFSKIFWLTLERCFCCKEVAMFLFSEEWPSVDTGTLTDFVLTLERCFCSKYFAIFQKLAMTGCRNWKCILINISFGKMFFLKEVFWKIGSIFQKIAKFLYFFIVSEIVLGW